MPSTPYTRRQFDVRVHAKVAVTPDGHIRNDAPLCGGRCRACEFSEVKVVPYVLRENYAGLKCNEDEQTRFVVIVSNNRRPLDKLSCFRQSRVIREYGLVLQNVLESFSVPSLVRSLTSMVGPKIPRTLAMGSSDCFAVRISIMVVFGDLIHARTLPAPEELLPQPTFSVTAYQAFSAVAGSLLPKDGALPDCNIDPAMIGSSV